MPDRNQLAILSPAIACVLLMSSPAALGQRGNKGSRSADYARDFITLRREFVDRFALVIEDASDRIIASTNDRAVQREAVLFKIRAIGECRGVIYLNDPHEVTIDAWSLCLQLRHYLMVGDGRALFKEHQQIAIEAVDYSERDLFTMMNHIAGEDAAAEIQARVEAWVIENPIRGPLARVSARPGIGSSQSQGLRRQLTGLIPVIPLKSLDETTRQLQALRHVADQMRATAELLPQGLRWQMELFMYDLEDRQSTESTIRSVASMAATADRLVTVAESLPQDLGAQLVAPVDDLSHRHAELQETITATRSLVAESRMLLTQGDGTADSVAEASLRLASAGEAWEGTFRAIHALYPEPSDEPSTARPFDITEYTATAESLTRAAGELNQLLADVREMGDAGILATTLHQAESRGRGLVDHVAWRAGQLAGVIFLLLLFYRLVERWVFGSSRGGSAGGAS